MGAQRRAVVVDALNATHKSRKWRRTDSLLQTAACTCDAKVRGCGDFSEITRVECLHSTRCSAKDSRGHVFGHFDGRKPALWSSAVSYKGRSHRIHWLACIRKERLNFVLGSTQEEMFMAE